MTASACLKYVACLKLIAELRSMEYMVTIQKFRGQLGSAELARVWGMGSNGFDMGLFWLSIMDRFKRRLHVEAVYNV
jgi:hypothetical protein